MPLLHPRLFSSVLVGIAVLVAGCAGGPGGPTPEKQSGALARPGQADLRGAWEATVAAAEREGVVTVSGPAHALWRKSLLEFQSAYPKIKLELTDFNSRDFWVRLGAERSAGQFLWDLRIGGPDPQVFEAKRNGWLAPMRPELIQPGVRDDSKWTGGLDALFADDDRQYLPSFVAQAQYLAYINRSVVPESALKDEHGLLDPTWRGKMAIQDPRGGAGLGTLTTMLVAFGEDYVTTLLSTQDVVVTGDNRRLAEWLVRGQYPIAIGIAPEDFDALAREGVKAPIAGLGLPRKLSLGSGGIQYINNAPHPNAARVFMNWILTQDAQTKIVEYTRANVRRNDVPQGNPETLLDPALLHTYVPHQTEPLLPQRQRAQQLGQQLIK